MHTFPPASGTHLPTAWSQACSFNEIKNQPCQDNFNTQISRDYKDTLINVWASVRRIKTDTLQEAIIKYLHKLHTKYRLLHQMQCTRSEDHETSSNMRINPLVHFKKNGRTSCKEQDKVSGKKQSMWPITLKLRHH